MTFCAQSTAATIPCRISGFLPFPATKPKLSRTQCLAIADALLTANNTPNISAEVHAWLSALGFDACALPADAPAPLHVPMNGNSGE